jgi:hypothetical protein
MSDETDEGVEKAAKGVSLALALGAISTALDAIDVEYLALHVAVSTMRDEKTVASTRARFILQIAVQWQALQKFTGGK